MNISPIVDYHTCLKVRRLTAKQRTAIREIPRETSKSATAESLIRTQDLSILNADSLYPTILYCHYTRSIAKHIFIVRRCRSRAVGSVINHCTRDIVHDCHLVLRIGNLDRHSTFIDHFHTMHKALIRVSHKTECCSMAFILNNHRNTVICSLCIEGVWSYRTSIIRCNCERSTAIDTAAYVNLCITCHLNGKAVTRSKFQAMLSTIIGTVAYL